MKDIFLGKEIGIPKEYDPSVFEKVIHFGIFFIQVALLNICYMRNLKKTCIGILFTSKINKDHVVRCILYESR